MAPKKTTGTVTRTRAPADERALKAVTSLSLSDLGKFCKGLCEQDESVAEYVHEHTGDGRSTGM